MRISDWSSDVGSSYLVRENDNHRQGRGPSCRSESLAREAARACCADPQCWGSCWGRRRPPMPSPASTAAGWKTVRRSPIRSEEHTSELQSLMRISYAVFCLKKKHEPDFRHTTYTTL